ncbi:MAG TPA: ATP-binding protein [Ramlibacter sp.]|nr:ATP-binding protein [Ramlibacter sp.]
MALTPTETRTVLPGADRDPNPGRIVVRPTSDVGQRVLAELSRRLRDSASDHEAMAITSALLGAHYRACRVGTAEIEDDCDEARVSDPWRDPSLASIAGRHRLSAYGAQFEREYRAGRAVAIDDLLAHDESVQLPPQACGARSQLVAPVLRMGRLVALFFVHVDEPRRWSGADRELLCEAAERTWWAIEHTRSTRELQDGERRAALLLRLMKAQRETDDPRVIMAAGAQAVGEYLGAHRAGFFHVQDDGALRFDEGAGWTDGTQAPFSGVLSRRRVGERCIAHALEGHAVSFADADDHPLVRDLRLRALGVRACIAAPVIRNGRWVAGFYVDHAQARDWTEREVSLAREVADQVWDGIERAEALAKLRVSQARLETAVSVAHLGTFEWDAGTGAFALDARCREILGFAGDEAVASDDVFGRMHPEDAGRVRALCEEKLCAGEPIEASFRLLLQGGVIRHVHSAGRVCHGMDGSVSRVFGVFKDVTEQQEADDRLRDSEAKFRTIANAMPQIVWSTRGDGYHDYFNDQWYEFTAMAPGTAVGAGWAAALHTDDRPRSQKRWRLSLATGEPYEVQYRLLHHSGEYRWVLGRALPVRNDAGEVIRWMGTCTDIHDHRMAQDELLANNRRKDEFLAMLAHELRNPLAPISTAAHLLRAAPDKAEHVARSAEIISRQVRHMTTLVDDLLDVSRVTRGLAQLTRETVDLKSVIASAIEQAHPLMDARSHALVTELDSGPLLVEGDRTRLAQVVSNLLNNAARYTPTGGRITLSLSQSADKAEIRVSDNGTGIDPELLPHLFELFTQGKRSPDRAQGGLGLGLALVRSLVELHRGHVHVESAGRGQGSAFTVYLPLLREAPSEANACAPMDVATAAGAQALDILVVDDNVDAAESLAAYLETEGHTVRVAHDGEAALRDAASAWPDVFILDIGLPGIDGYELARRLRTGPRGNTSRFIALTGYGQDQDRARTVAAGFHEHMVKPADLLELSAALKAR